MAGVFVGHGVGGAEDHFATPGFGVVERVADLEAVENAVFGDAGEALDDFALGRDGRRVARRLQGVQVDRLDNEGVAVPVRHRIAEPGRKFRRPAPAADGDDAGVMHHFHQNHQVIVGLHNLVQVVVQHVVHHRPAGAAKADDAALAERAALGPVIARKPRPVLAAQLLAALGKWNAAVFGIGDPGSAGLAADNAETRAGIDPEGVVAPAPGQVAAIGQLPLHLIVVGGLAHVLVIVPRHLRKPLARNHQAEFGVVVGALQGCQRGVGPIALEIGMPGSRARRLPGSRVILGQRPSRQQQQRKRRKSSQSRHYSHPRLLEAQTPASASRKFQWKS